MSRGEWFAVIALAIAVVVVVVVMFGEVHCTGASAEGPFADCVWRWK